MEGSDLPAADTTRAQNASRGNDAAAAAIDVRRAPTDDIAHTRPCADVT